MPIRARSSSRRLHSADLNLNHGDFLYSLRTADAFPVVASLRPEMLMLFAGTRLSLYHDQEAIYFILACKFYGQDMPVKICVFFAAKGYSLNKLS